MLTIIVLRKILIEGMMNIHCVKEKMNKNDLFN